MTASLRGHGRRGGSVVRVPPVMAVLACFPAAGGARTMSGRMSSEGGAS